MDVFESVNQMGQLVNVMTSPYSYHFYRQLTIKLGNSLFASLGARFAVTRSSHASSGTSKLAFTQPFV